MTCLMGELKFYISNATIIKEDEILYLNNWDKLKLIFYVYLSRYILVYFTIMYIRYHAGIVTDEMLSMPKAPFLLVGFLEALAAATGMAAAGNANLVILCLFSAAFFVLILEIRLCGVTHCVQYLRDLMHFEHVMF